MFRFNESYVFWLGDVLIVNFPKVLCQRSALVLVNQTQSHILGCQKTSFMRVDFFNPGEFSLMSDAACILTKGLQKTVELGCKKLVLTGAKSIVKNMYFEALKEYKVDFEVDDTLSVLFKKIIPGINPDTVL